MIGNETDAALALTGDAPVFSYAGSTRTVYLIDNVIYKVNKMGDEVWDDNASEWEHFLILRDRLPSPFRVPEMTLYTIGNEAIIAAEYITGSHTGECSSEWTDICECIGECIPTEMVHRLMSIGWSDPVWGNAIINNGIFYLVDIG